MITEELCECPKCKFVKALTHWSTDGIINWVACPKCKTFFDQGIESQPCSKQGLNKFWSHVIYDTGYEDWTGIKED